MWQMRYAIILRTNSHYIPPILPYSKTLSLVKKASSDDIGLTGFRVQALLPHPLPCLIHVQLPYYDTVVTWLNTEYKGKVVHVGNNGA